jgi:biopolymer transport protein ExbD
MRVPTSRRSRTAMSTAAMTPMIDIVFQLLIFFICASVGYLREQLLPTDFAAGSVRDAAEPVEQPLGEVWIRLRRDGDQTVPTVEGTPYPDWPRFTTVLTTLAETAAEIPVILDIAGDVPVGDALRVYDACRAAGFQSLSFAAEAKGAINAP